MTNHISIKDIERIRGKINVALLDLDRTVRENYNQDEPNANHIADVLSITNAINGLLLNIVGSINRNPDDHWGYIPTNDGYIVEKITKIIHYLHIKPSTLNQMKLGII